MGVYNIGGTVNEIYPYMIDAVMQAPEVPSRNGKTRELHPAMIELYSPRKRLLTAFGRPVNVPFALAEVLWILGGRDDVNMLSHYNSRIHEYSDDGVRFNAAYGDRLRKAHGHDQLDDVIKCLTNDPESRQAILNIWHPLHDRSYEEIPSHNEGVGDSLPTVHITKDRACNVLAHALIRNNTLDWTQIIRSNDIMWGVPYNWMQWTHVMEYVATCVGVELGHMFYMADSLHIYDYHWDEAEGISYFDLYLATNYEHEPLRPSALHLALQAEQMIRRTPPSQLLSMWNLQNFSALGEYWTGVLQVLLAYRFFKDQKDEEAISIITSCMDKVYAAATMRFWYGIRWSKWLDDSRSYIDDIIDECAWGLDSTASAAIAAWIRA